MRIVVEGPDGSGKSTLIQRLLNDLNMEPAQRYSDSIEGPRQNIWEHTMESFEQDLRGVIYDRHPAISEPIYANIIPGRSFDGRFMKPLYMEARQEWYRDTALILCLPPKDVVLEAIRDGEHMAGVQEHGSEIYDYYQRLTHDLVNGGGRLEYPGKVYQYDYTNDNYYRLVGKLWH